jgi:hypothetical protein
MPNSIIILLALGLIGAGLYYFFFSKRATVASAIAKTKEKQMHEVTDGEEVTLQGRVVLAGRSLTAPLSKRKCVYYHVKVEDNSSRKDIFRNYIDIEEEKTADIVISDGENYAVVDTKLINHYVIKDDTHTSGFWSSTCEELKTFLVKHGERPTDWLGWSMDLYATEAVLEESEHIVIAGKAYWKNAKDFRIKVPAQKVLLIKPLNEYGVYVTDDVQAVRDRI